MSVRRLIAEIDPASVNVTEFCAQHGVSTWFFWDLRRRVAAEGAAGLEPRSRAPRRVANKTPAAIEDLVVKKRKELVDAGLDAGAATIRWHLRSMAGVPSESTIWRILTARGFITADPSKAPKGTGRRFAAEKVNELWQLDDTGWELADHTQVKILNIVDDCSRLLAVSATMTACTGDSALGAMAAGAVVLGWPERFLSDNATAFRYVLADAAAAMGVAAGHSRPYHPQTNGKVERFHLTLKKWLNAQPAAATIDELQAQLDIFRFIYNHQRPHRSINRRTPAQVWETTPSSGPADRPLGTPTRIYNGTVHNGRVPAGARYQITIGATHNRQPALTVITGTNAHVFINGRLIRQLTIDPTKNTQPLHNRPGRP